MDALVIGAQIMPPQDAIIRQLQQLAASSLGLALTGDELDAMSRLDEYAGVDSLAILIFVHAVEKHFSVKLDSDALTRQSINNLPNLASLLARRLKSEC